MANRRGESRKRCSVCDMKVKLSMLVPTDDGFLCEYCYEDGYKHLYEARLLRMHVEIMKTRERRQRQCNPRPSLFND